MLFNKLSILAASIASASAAALVTPQERRLLDSRDLVCPCDSTHLVVLYPILVNTVFTINETIDLGGFSFVVNNAPTSISTVVTGTTTTTVTTTTATTATSLPTVNPAIPFILQLTGTNLAKRQTSAFLGANGGAMNDCHAAAVFTISPSGQLSSNGLTVSANAGVNSAPFTLSANAGTINSVFSVVDNVLAWANPSFVGDDALFCFQGNALLAVFNGVLPPGCAPQSLIHVPASACPAVSTTASIPQSIPQSTPIFPTSSGFRNSTTSAGGPTNVPTPTQSVVSTPSSAPTTIPSDGEEDTDPTFISQMLFWHNTYRANNRALPLVWNATLAKVAQQHSDACVFQHSGGPYGENLAEGTYQNAPLYIYLWYNEQSVYDFDNPNVQNFEQWGHFSQLVWQNSMQVGCGYATTATCQFNYLTCEYFPPGNFLDPASLAANVQRPISSTVPQPASFKKV